MVSIGSHVITSNYIFFNFLFLVFIEATFIVSKISFSVPSKPSPASGIASRASVAGSDFWIPSADTPVRSYVNVSTS
jgi:hypothetical protein